MDDKPIVASDLDPNEIAALNECAYYSRAGRPYWWREASMRKLEARGLVEKHCPPSVAERPRMKSRPWRPTEAGLRWLRLKGVTS